MSLTNEQAGIMKMDVGFYYERYRFYGQSEFDDVGRSYGFGGGLSAGDNMQYNQFNTAPKVATKSNANATDAK